MQTDNPCALQVIKLHKRLGQTPILNGLDLTVQPGTRLGIIGPNGAGKSTLFNLISGRCRPSSGQIWLNGRRIDGQAPWQINRMGLSRSFQTRHLFPNLSVLDHLRCGVLWPLGYRYAFWTRFAHQPRIKDRTETLLSMVQLDKQRHTLAMHLCHADQCALELALALASDASVVLLDEPTAGMSLPEADRMLRLIGTVTADKTLLIIEHDMGVVFGLADKIAVLAHGTWQAFGTADDIRANADVRRAYLGQTAAPAVFRHCVAPCVTSC